MKLLKLADGNGLKFFAGNFLFLLTGLFYICWWTLSFLPGGNRNPQLSSGIMISMLALGGAGLFFLGFSFNSIKQRLFPVFYIFAIAALLYIVMFFVTKNILNRAVTSELLIILVFAAFELSILDCLCGMKQLGVAAGIISAVSVLVSTAVGFLCYIPYFNLSGMSQFVCGLIPIVLDSAVVFLIMLLQIFA